MHPCILPIVERMTSARQSAVTVGRTAASRRLGLWDSLEENVQKPAPSIGRFFDDVVRDDQREGMLIRIDVNHRLDKARETGRAEMGAVKVELQSALRRSGHPHDRTEDHVGAVVPGIAHAVLSPADEKAVVRVVVHELLLETHQPMQMHRVAARDGMILRRIGLAEQLLLDPRRNSTEVSLIVEFAGVDEQPAGPFRQNLDESVRGEGFRRARIRSNERGQHG